MTARLTALTPPHPLAADHELDAFCSGVAPLDEWLIRHARANEAAGASRTFALCVGSRVVGYYSLAAGSLMLAQATGRARRNMPNPIPAILLGRLAIDRAWQGKGLGTDLLRDAVLRILSAGDVIGVRVILVHAISPEAKLFYEKSGFRPSPIEPMTLMITLADAKRAFLGSDEHDGPTAT